MTAARNAPSGQEPVGYKQTEVGVIPEDWEVGSLEAFWSVTDCKHLTAKFVHNGFPLASIQQVQSRYIDLANAKQTTQQFYNQLIGGGRKPQVDDLIISRNATVGEVARVAEWHPAFAMGQDVCLLRKRSSNFSTEFLQSVFGSSIIGSQLRDLMVGSTFKRINVRQIKDFNIPMPPTAEQEAIAEALSDADALIESLEQLIAKKRQIKQGAMQELLTPPQGSGQAGKKRLPGFSGEWEVKTLGRVATLSKGTQLHASEAVKDGKFAHLNGGITPSSYTDKSNTAGNTIAISEGGNSCGFVQFMAEPFWCGGHCYSVIPNGIDNRFLYHALKWRQTAIMGLRVGSGLPNVQKSGLLDFKIDIPRTHTEQTVIATILSDMDAEIAALETKLSKARQVKQGMMQELLTGKTRLV